MIEPINTDKENVEVTIIPKLKNLNVISLSQGETLLITIDKDKYDLDQAKVFYNLFNAAFPYNQVLVCFDGIEISVIKENN